MTNPIETAVAEWMVDRDMKQAGPVLQTTDRLCWHFANKQHIACRIQGVDPQDLYQEAQMGVLRALSKYDPEKCKAFTNYAGYWILAFINRYMEKYNTVSFGRSEHVRKLRYRYRSLCTEFRESTPGITLTEIHELIAGQVGCAVKFVDAYHHATRGFAPLDVENEDGPDLPMPEVTTAPMASNEYHFEILKLRDLVDAFCDKLDPRDADIVRNRIAAQDHKSTLQIFADRYGTSRQRIEQLEKRLERNLIKHCKLRMSI